MKAICLLFVVMSVQAQAARPNRCAQVAKEYAYEIYSTDCGGNGKMRDCEQTTRITNGKMLTSINCWYSGEPDYSDALEIDLVLDPRTCQILQTEVKLCYEN